MAQTALNGQIELASGAWTLLSEVNCTFQVVSGAAQILCMDGAAPTASDAGVVYQVGEGEEASTDVLARYPGAGTADRIYGRAHASLPCVIFISRAAVA
jgi:hypothetical protein